MLMSKKGALVALLLVLTATVIAQRQYAPASVLATGAWYRLSVPGPGLYRINISFLNKLGLTGSSFPSASIRIFGNGGRMLPEANNQPRPDDLQENAIWVEDGGDNTLNGPDYILFYADGPHTWAKDSANQRFIHQKNIYSDRSYYYLSIGGAGARVPVSNIAGNPGTEVSQFSSRYFHELDTLNFLASGKEWYGEEFSDLPGRSLSRQFSFRSPNPVAASSLLVRTQCISRSVGNASRFDIRVNGGSAQSFDIAPTGAGLYDAFAREATGQFSGTATGEETGIQYNYVPGSFNAQGWLNWFEVFGRQQLSLNGMTQLLFRDWVSVSPGLLSFRIANADADTRVWDVTDPLHPVQMNGSISGNEYRFINDGSRLREYVAVHRSGFLEPEPGGRVVNQDLHGTAPTDMIIVTYPPFRSQAERLADFHQQHDGMKVQVVTTDQIFNEFASGIADPSAIRDYIKMYIDKYRGTPDSLHHLLLFGDASYDYKDRLANNTNFVPAYQHSLSLDILSTYTTDDFFGFLDDEEDINSGSIQNLLDIGIGRVPARNEQEAKNFVDKVEAYHRAAAMGPWRNQLTFIADDEDQNLHLQDAEVVANTAATVAPVFDQLKIYLDAYRQESGSAGSRYPTANQAINNQVYNGTLLWNYAGHGGPRRLAEETIIDQEIVNGWNNPDRLPLFLTATCDFAPYDNPLLPSLGEQLLLRAKTGAIALMTTTRIVFSFSNREMNNNYLRFALDRGTGQPYRNLGDAVREAKNYTYRTSGDVANNRKFTLLGDPALRIAYPTYKVVATKVNGLPVTQVDTLSAGEKVIMEGEVTDAQGNLLTGFNGTVYPSVFDKPQSVNTLGNDASSPVTSFTTQTNSIFKGKATVTGGRFSFAFRVPKDINYRVGDGRLSLYADNGVDDGNGLFTGFRVGGTGTGDDDDKDGPSIKAYLNDEKFVSGGITNQDPVLLLRLQDSSGINTVGTGIGHDIIATLDNDNTKFFILNDFYQGELDSYQKGTVRFQLPAMEPGHHTLNIKAWDVVNNSNEIVLDFTVASNEEFTLKRVLNYPNPFTTHTSFWFEHNRPGQDLYVRLQIFTLTGRVIKVLQKTINTPGNRSSDLEWDGRDEFGDKIGRGVYLYKLSVTTPEKQKKEKIEKLVIF